MKHIAFPDIGQFRNAIRYVQNRARYIGKDENGDPIYDGSKPLPKIVYRGTVKNHGSNAGLNLDLKTGEIGIQSRENMITVENDNAGFAKFVASIPNIKDLFGKIDMAVVTNPNNGPILEEDVTENHVVIYGEWCGGNVQKGVALNQLEKMLIVFAVNYRGTWVDATYLRNIKMPECKIYNILDFPTFEVEIDFNYPELIQNKLIEITTAIEKECPVGKTFGVSGIGEGAVWVPLDFNIYNDSGYWFKVKGEKHSVSKVKKLAAVDTEKVETIREFVENVVTDNRCRQGVDMVKQALNVPEIERKHIGDFIRWVFNDVKKEESDTITASGLDDKEIGGAIAKKAKEWFFKNCEKI